MAFLDAGDFARLDRAAGNRTRGELDGLRATLKESGYSDEQIEALLAQAFGEGFETGDSAAWQSWYTENLRDGISQRWDGLLRNETRLGRAVTIFDEGQSLPSEQFAFLSAFVVLENLFNTEPGEIIYKIALRGSKLLWTYGRETPAVSDLCCDTIEKVRKRIEELYKERSQVTHGAVSFRQHVTKETERVSFFLARGALQTILLMPDLCDRFAAKDTEGMQPESLRRFFRNLELL